MGAAALLRAGRSHRQLPLNDVKYRGARHPLHEGCRAPSYVSYGAMPDLEASAATRSAPRLHSRFSGALGLSALYANLHRIKSETIRRAHAMHLTGIHRLAGVTVRSHHLTGR